LARLQGLRQISKGLADDAPPSVGVLLVGRAGGGQVEKRSVSFCENRALRGGREGSNTTGPDIDADDPENGP
jgi:hypothetical protein